MKADKSAAQPPPLPSRTPLSSIQTSGPSAQGFMPSRASSAPLTSSLPPLAPPAPSAPKTSSQNVGFEIFEEAPAPETAFPSVPSGTVVGALPSQVIEKKSKENVPITTAWSGTVIAQRSFIVANAPHAITSLPSQITVFEDSEFAAATTTSSSSAPKTSVYKIRRPDAGLLTGSDGKERCVEEYRASLDRYKPKPRPAPVSQPKDDIQKRLDFEYVYDVRV